MRTSFPFTAIVGQEDMKQALLIAAVAPAVGGVLVFGDRGSGKTTTVRALADLLPPIETVEGCAYRCPIASPAGLCAACAPEQGHAAPKRLKTPVPFVDLPLGATEDRVAGALDLEHVLLAGKRRFEPGLLARANRGFLYIDEINLLEDHLVDLLLDVAASGENVVEREGLSVRHPARFVLVGSGNPEEGELRPQLLDRFGLSVEVSTPQDLALRLEIVRRREAFERDPSAFSAQWADAQTALRKRVERARRRVDEIIVPDPVLELAARLCMQLGTDGLRGELTLMRAARASAALEGRREVQISHLRAVAPSALRHRLRRNPLDDAGSGVRIERAMEEILPR
jgi:magnesium chelatase subunit I